MHRHFDKYFHACRNRHSRRAAMLSPPFQSLQLEKCKQAYIDARRQNADDNWRCSDRLHDRHNNADLPLFRELDVYLQAHLLQRCQIFNYNSAPYVGSMGLDIDLRY
jgi:hypothetical protein